MSGAAVPELRFPEFEGDWCPTTLGQIHDVSSASRVHKDEWEIEGIPFFRSSDVVAAFKGRDNHKAFISEELYEELATKSGKPKSGDMLVTGGGSIGIPYLLNSDDPIYFKDADLLWVKTSDLVSPRFIFYFFVSPTFRHYLHRITHIGTIAHYTIEQAKATPLVHPRLQEQKKIAAFLSAVDAKISALETQAEGWRTYKRGLMQALFSQTLRFKADDGSDFPEWDERRLRDLAKRSKKKNADYEVSRVLSNSATIGIVDQTDYFDRQITTASNLDGYYIVDEGDFVYNPRVSQTAPVGPIRRNNLGKGVMSPLYTVFSAKPDFADYLEVYFKSDHWYEYVYRVSNVGARHDRMNITNDDFMDMPIPLPYGDERKKIASFVSEVERKGRIVCDHLDHLRTFKRGLLQKMFV